MNWEKILGKRATIAGVSYRVAREGRHMVVRPDKMNTEHHDEMVRKHKFQFPSVPVTGQDGAGFVLEGYFQ